MRSALLRGRGAYGLWVACLLAAPVIAAPKADSPAQEQHAATGAPTARDPYASVLMQQKITPDADGITRYFRGMIPTDADRRQLRSLISQLADLDAERRDAATRQLIELGVVPAQELRDAAGSDVVEQRVRAQHVLSARSNGNANSSLAVACFRTIVRQKITGMSDVVLTVLPLYCEEFVQSAGRDALRATARANDVLRLRQAACGGPVESRVAAIGALSHLTAGEDPAPIRRLLGDAQPRVKLAAAVALARRGDRACLGTLVELLASNDHRVRHVSAATLRSLTGRSSEYVAWLDPEEQPGAIREWALWLAKDGASAKLHFPPASPEAELGRTLICLYARNEVLEMDAAGRETLNVSESGGCPWACHGLSNGSRLVAMYSTNLVVEYGPDGKERNRIAVPGGPMSVQRLENGNTLVACNNAQKVVEVTDDGKIAWEVDLPGGPCDAQRLDNGNTLVALQNTNQVVEIDPTGRETWKLEDLHTPRTAQRLDSGNTLVCDLGSGRIVEYDPAGREVWSHDGFSSPFSAQRLTSGTTLVSDTESVKEIDHAGKVIWESKQPSMGRVWRY